MINSKKLGKDVQITLIKSVSGRLQNHKACVQGLGLKRIGQTVTLKQDSCISGMINKVSYLLKVEEK
jgi:large subunit ribosomal protein L30